MHRAYTPYMPMITNQHCTQSLATASLVTTSNKASYNLRTPFRQHTAPKLKWLHKITVIWQFIYISLFGDLCLFKLQQTSFNATLLKCKPPLQKSICSCCNLNLWPLTFKTTCMVNICSKFYWNPSTKQSDITSHQIGVTCRTTDGWTDNCKI